MTQIIVKYDCHHNLRKKHMLSTQGGRVFCYFLVIKKYLVI